MEINEKLEGNEIIAEFDFERKDWRKMAGCIAIKDQPLEYHNNWSWLMPIVERIEDIENGRFLFSINSREIVIEDWKELPEQTIIQIDRYDEESKIEMVWEAVVEFIKWYNKVK